MLFRPAIVAALSIVAALLISCTGADQHTNSDRSAAANNADNSNLAKTNVEELGMLIDIPYQTEEANWKTYDDGKRLIAVLRFSTEDADRIVEELGREKAPASAEIESETWFPAELAAQSDASGDKTLKGEAYPATPFLQPPYISGRMTRIIGTDYFILEASSD